MLPTVDTAGKHIASGIVEIDGADVVAVPVRGRFAQAGAGAALPPFEEVRVGMDRAPSRWRRRHRRRRDHHAQGIRALRAHLGLLDAGAAEGVAKPASSTKRPSDPGAPPKHGWDAFAGAIARRLHDHDVPISQGELVRDMMDGLTGRGGFPAARRAHGAQEGASVVA